jgi:outer membrane protein OmpA-like peptidoglycan-associated protein
MAADQAGCLDSKFFPKLLECRIDHCEKKATDHRNVAAAEDESGDVVNAPLDGKSRSVMYECREETTPAFVVDKAATALKAAGFDIPYKYSDAEASLTARKGDSWIIVEAASRYYTLSEIEAIPPDFDSVSDADSIALALLRYGHVPLSGVDFLPKRPDLTPSSADVLEEVVALLKAHPTWRVRVEGHTDNVGLQVANLQLSRLRADVIVRWLTAKGIRRARLDQQGYGDAQPVADNLTAAGRNKNARIEMVRIADVQNPLP